MTRWCLILSACVLSTACLVGATTVRIRPDRTVYEVSEGDGMSLSCEVSGLSTYILSIPRLAWQDSHGSRIRSTFPKDRVYLLNSGDRTTVVVNRVKKEDAGMWICSLPSGHSDRIRVSVWKKVYFVDMPMRQTFVRGSDSLVKCVVDSRPAATIQWKFNGRFILPGSKYNFQEDGLLVRDTEKTDGGVYTCWATIKSKNYLGFWTIDVTVNDSSTSNDSAMPMMTAVNASRDYKSCPPTITTQPKRLSYFMDNSKLVELQCQAVGSPELKYSWTKNGKVIDVDNSGRISRVRGSGTLRIRAPGVQDVGFYQCSVSNSHGVSLSVPSRLQRAFIDFINKRPLVLHPRVGSSLSLRCDVPRSVPDDVRVMWTTTGGGVRDVRPFVEDNRVYQDVYGNLHFTNVREEDRSERGRRYECAVRNDVARSMVLGRPYTIKPREAARMTQIPAQLITSTPMFLLELEGNELRLQCVFSGNPTPKVKWFKGKTDVSLIPWIRVEEKAGHSLVIDKVTFNDTGSYECRGTNNVTRQAPMRKFKVELESRPYWISEPQKADVPEGSTVTFVCHAGGVPKPRIRWFINGKPMTGLARNTKSITFPYVTLKDEKVLQCNASNQHGYIWADVYLNVVAVTALVTFSTPVIYKRAPDD